MKKTGGGAKIVSKGSNEYRHDLWKTNVSKALRNTSWKKDHVKLEEIEHTHIFHSCDSRGRPQRYSTMSAGHFHEVSWKELEDGTLVATCGPALWHKHIKTADGHKKILQKVQWKAGKTYDDDGNETYGRKYDTHTHEMHYKHSEVLTENKVNESRADTVAAVGAMMGGAKPKITSPDGNAADLGMHMDAD